MTTLQRLIEFLQSYAARFDAIINALQAKLDTSEANAAGYQAETAAAKAEAEGFKTEAEGLRTANAALIVERDGFKTEAEALRDRVAELEATIAAETELEIGVGEVIDQFTPTEPVPEVTPFEPAPVTPFEPEVVAPEVEEAAAGNDASNPTQAVDELVDFIEKEPAAETEGLPTETVNTPVGTPPEVLNDALVAEAEAIEAELGGTPAPATDTPAATPEQGIVAGVPAPDGAIAPAPEAGTVSFSGGENAPTLES